MSLMYFNWEHEKSFKANVKNAVTAFSYNVSSVAQSAADIQNSLKILSENTPKLVKEVQSVAGVAAGGFAQLHTVVQEQLQDQVLLSVSKRNNELVIENQELRERLNELLHRVAVLENAEPTEPPTKY